MTLNILELFLQTFAYARMPRRQIRDLLGLLVLE